MICETGLLFWLVWWLQPYERPAFCLLILVMGCAHASYHVPRTDAEYHASAITQAIALGLAVSECLWKVMDRPRLPVALVALGTGMLVILTLKGLDYRFGGFTTNYVTWLCFCAGVSAGGALAAWDRRLCWLALWCGARGVAGLSFWFIRDGISLRGDPWPAWWTANGAVQAAMLVLTLGYFVMVPVSATEPATRTQSQR